MLLLQLLEEVRYDRIATVRAGAAAAWAEFSALPDPPVELTHPDASPSASPDKAASSRRGGKRGSKLAAAARSVRSRCGVVKWACGKARAGACCAHAPKP